MTDDEWVKLTGMTQAENSEYNQIWDSINRGECEAEGCTKQGRVSFCNSKILCFFHRGDK